MKKSYSIVCLLVVASLMGVAKKGRLATHIDVPDLADQPIAPAVVSTQEAAVSPLVPVVPDITPQGSAFAKIIEPRPDEGSGFNIEAKRRQVIALVEKGAAFIQNNPLDKAFNSFTHGKEFIQGELYLFVYSMNGVALAHGQESNLVWRNLIDMRDPYGTFIVRNIIHKAKEGGGWITYNWRNATKVSYVQKVTKDGKEYVIGSGYYPHSKRDAVVSLVKGAVAYFNEVVHRQNGQIDEAFSALSYPFGRFVYGDLYLYAIRFDGVVMANGDRPGIIGTNMINVRDDEGMLIHQETIAKLKESPKGVWIEYRNRNAFKLTYAEQITDKKGNHYFIACGYYPDANRNEVVNLVRNGYEFMKKEGLSVAVREFSDRRKNTFRYGDLYLVLYDLNGVCIAHGNNPEFIGLKQIDLKDEDGRLMVKEMIEKAKQGGGWLDFKLRNAFQSVFVQTVDLGIETYVITSGCYPVSKSETTLLLVRSAAGLLREQPQEKVYEELANKNSSFIRGDLSVFVIDFRGICRVYGDTFDLIWRNLMDVKDDSGQYYVRAIINTVKAGPGKVNYRINGQQRIVYAEMVEKDGEQFAVGAGYFE